MQSLTIFFPCYNDSKTIGDLVKKAEKVAKKLTKDFEIIVIDDGSSDNSRQVLLKAAKRNKNLKLIFHERNRGYGGALQSGFKAASKDVVFYTDGDGQYDVQELEILWLLLTDDVDFVNGIKMDRQDYSYRVVLGNLYAFVTRWMFLLKMYDVDCDFRLIRTKILRKVNLWCRSGAVCVDLVKKAQLNKAKFRHVGVHHYERRHGRSQFFRPRRLWDTGVELIRLWLEIFAGWKKQNI